MTNAACYSGVQLHVTDPNIRPAIDNAWNLTIQHQFGSATTIQAAYVGSHADHLSDIVWLDGGPLINGVQESSPFLGGAAANSLVYFNNVGSARYNQSVAISNYNALQLTAQRRLANGLALQANYVWSKCLSDNNGYYARWGDASAPQTPADKNFQEDAYDIMDDYGRCNQDMTGVFTGYVTYDLPFGKGKAFGSSMNPVADAIFGGWEANVIFNVHTGLSVTPFDTNWGGAASAEPRPDCNGPAVQTKQESASGGWYYFEPYNMSAPSSTQYGTCGVGVNQGPGFKDFDIALGKTFSITQRQKVEFKAEAINAFNSVIYAVNGVYSGAAPDVGTAVRLQRM